MIREKRGREKITLRTVADQCGVAFSTISRLERAQGGKPDLETLERIAEWLKVPPPVLFTEPQPVEAHLRARKQLDSTTAAALRELILAAKQQYAPTKTRISPVAHEEDTEHGPIPRDQWEVIAESIRHDLGAKPDDPVEPFDLKIRGVSTALAQQIHGVPPDALDHLLGQGAPYWSAATIPLDEKDRWLIVLNSAHNRERQRASLMEEYCHVLLGHDMTQLSHQEGVTFRDYLAVQEQEAYYIGAAILVPQAALRARLGKPQSAERIAKHFGVSTDLVEYRIKRSGLWYLYRLRPDQQH
jgi:transcriptional regulator with XRE-family HTH domain